MVATQDQKSDVEPTSDNLDGSAGGCDPPPAYDGVHQAINHNQNREASSSTFPGLAVAGFSNGPPGSDSASFNPSILNTDKPLPPRPPSPDDAPSPPRNASPVLAQGLHVPKNTSWLSFLPFVPSFSTKRVRQSVLSAVSDLVVPPSRVGSEEQKNVHEILASIAETCAEHKLSLSTMLQETSIADHTPMYWAVVHYRQELLVALLVHSRPLSIQTISDIRRACLVSSNQPLFHALRVCRSPFHRTDGIQVQSLRAASDSLLLGDRPLDEIHVTQATEQAFVVSIVIPLWQRRMKAIGKVGIEFIASSRMWSVTFFSADPSSQIATSRKSKRSTNTWHVIVSLLESSPPTYFDSQLVVDAPPPLVPESIQASGLREARSTIFLPSRDEEYQSRPSTYDHNYDGEAYSPLSRSCNVLAPSEQHGCPSPSSSTLPSPTHALQRLLTFPQSSTATLPPVSIRLECGSRKLGSRPGSGESSEPLETPTTKPDTWSDHGVGYTNAAVSLLGEGLTSQLLYDHSPYLFPDGTLRGRLEARFVQSESSKDCIIC